MNTQRLIGRAVAARLLIAAAFGSVPAVLPAQNDPEQLERLRRDQDEILRKAERLQALMQRLMQRYARENKADQIVLLKEGLAHLERSGILREVASIRDDIAATAFTEALRKQKEVVDDLERLLNILLERKSVENLDQELQQVEAQARTARELEQRQRELIDAAREAARSEPSAAEQALIDGLEALRDGERREAERNLRQAGTRRPFLESALERVRELLRGQQQLEQGLADEAAGRTPAARAREFDLGDLTQRTRELQGELRDQGRTRALGDAARELQKEAGGADQQALQQARDRLEAGATEAPKVAAGPEGKVRDPEWAKVREQLKAAPAGTSDAERQELGRIGGEAAELAKKRDQEAAAANAQTAADLQEAAAQLAQRMREQGAAAAPQGKEKEDAAQAVEQAGSRLEQARAAEQAGDVAEAQKKVNEALSALDRARTLHQQQHPDAGRQAGQMAAESSSTAQELQNAPSGESAEQAAAGQLRAAADALRKVEAGVESNREQQTPPEQTKESAGAARQQLEAAERALQEALAAASGDSQQEMQAAAARQQELQQQAAKAAEQLQRAVEQNQLTAEQARAAAERLQQARGHMQNAQQKLQSGQQANAAGEQQQAADAVQQAADALEENRPMSDAQRQQLQQQAKAQEQLADDIIKLAQELKKRDNKAAQRAVQQAAEAARKAQRAMEQGDEDETDEQQEEARQQLEEASKELEEEQDRYQDLRQEELLFRMKDELTTFLDRQRPITAQTLEAQRTAPAEGLSRAMRIKIRQLGEEEQELAGKIDFLVQALTEEGNLVYQAVLKANHEDLRDVAQRLSVRNPDVGAFTTLLQQEVERRTEKLLEALERERQRRQQQRQEQQAQSGQQQGKNRFSPQQQKLVSLIAELEMLKQLGIDTRRSADDLRAVVEARGEDVVSPTEVALIERLGHRHGEITKLFQQIKQGVEEAMQQMQGEEGAEPGAEPDRGQGGRPPRGR